MQYRDVLQLVALLTKLAQVESQQATGVLPFPGDARLKLCSTLIDTEGAFEKYEKARLALVKQFGTEQPDKSVKVEGDKLEPFSVEHAKLLDADVKLTLDPVPMSALASAGVPFALITALVATGVANK